MLSTVPQAIPEGLSAHDCETEKTAEAAETANAEEADQEERRTC